MARRGGDFPRPPERPDGGSELEDFLRLLGSAGGNIGRWLPGIGGLGPGIVFAIALLVWLGTGIYQVDPRSQAIVRIFGVPQAPVGPGLNWRAPWPLGGLDIVTVEEVRSMELGFRTLDGGRTQSVPVEALMITGDQNIVDVEIVVQYRVKDIRSFLFDVIDPGDPVRGIRDRPDGRTLKDATEAALRQVVGGRALDDILTVERTAVEGETMVLLQELLDTYGAGIHVRQVLLQIVKPPQQVEAAFLDVVSAKEEKEQLINQARAFEADIIPKAQGEAQQMIREAEAFKEARIAQAKGDSARFLSILKEYQQAQDVTRTRLYLEAMEEVLPKIRKFIVTPAAGGNLLQFLPLQETSSPPLPAAPSPPGPAAGASRPPASPATPSTSGPAAGASR